MTQSTKCKKLSPYKLHKLIKIASRTNNIISKDLSQDPPDTNHFPSISPKTGKRSVHSWSLTLYMGHKLVTFEYSMGIKLQHSVCIIAQILPCKAVKILRPRRFCKTTFLIMETSELSKLMAWLPPFKTCWVNLVKLCMWLMIPSIPSEGTNIEIKWSYHWKTDWDQCAHIKDRLTGVVSKTILVTLSLRETNYVSS